MNDNPIDEGDDTIDGEILEPIETGVMAKLQRTEIDAQIATAKAYPRNVAKLKQELTALVTMDEETAEECIYALPRGKEGGKQKFIKGPSARFADALISFWGNARSGAFVTQVDREAGFVEAIGSFQDVERNVIRQRRVRRNILDRHGRVYNADMVNMTGNAACVIAERNAILNGIPKSLWSSAYERAFALVAGTTQSLGEKVERATKAFMAMGISMELVLEKLGYPADDPTKITPEDVVTIRGLLTALKTGEETPESLFGRGAVGGNHERVKNPLKDDPISTGAAKPAEQASKEPETASTQVEKTNTAAEAAGKASEGPSEKEAQDSGPVENNAQAATAPKADAGSKPEAPAKAYTDADGYMGWMRDQLDAAASKAAVTDVWGATRADRNDLLSPDQIDGLTKDKEAKLAKLKKGGA